MNDDIEIVEFEQRHAEQVSRFRAVFPLRDRMRSAGYYAWKYGPNPAGRPEVLLALRRGEIVGVHAAIPRIFKVEDREVVVYEFQDSYVRPDFQRRGIFRTLTERIIDRIRSRGHLFYYVVPNELAAPIWMTGFRMWEPFGLASLSLGPSISSRVAEHCTALTRVQFFMRTANLIDRVGFACTMRRTTGLEVAVVRGGSNVANVNVSIGLQMAPVHVRRDSAYLRWRYDANPEYLSIAEVTELGRPAGLLVWRIAVSGATRRAYLVDVMSMPGRLRSMTRLAVSLMLGVGASTISALSISGSPLATELLLAGFRTRPGGPRLLVCPAFRNDPFGPFMRQPERWFLSLGDTGDI
ncbi:MAG: GNAT family N-acetyltransferase [Planctomycetota bacterium]|nr:GNAT family N-acetyltransferase [Planctomycetota bacterium]